MPNRGQSQQSSSSTRRSHPRGSVHSTRPTATSSSTNPQSSNTASQRHLHSRQYEDVGDNSDAPPSYERIADATETGQQARHFEDTSRAIAAGRTDTATSITRGITVSISELPHIPVLASHDGHEFYEIDPDESHEIGTRRSRDGGASTVTGDLKGVPDFGPGTIGGRHNGVYYEIDPSASRTVGSQETEGTRVSAPPDWRSQRGWRSETTSANDAERSPRSGEINGTAINHEDD
jgi:hypothetical protein